MGHDAQRVRDQRACSSGRAWSRVARHRLVRRPRAAPPGRRKGFRGVRGRGRRAGARRDRSAARAGARSSRPRPARPRASTAARAPAPAQPGRRSQAEASTRSGRSALRQAARPDRVLAVMPDRDGSVRSLAAERGRVRSRQDHAGSSRTRLPRASPGGQVRRDDEAVLGARHGDVEQAVVLLPRPGPQRLARRGDGRRSRRLLPGDQTGNVPAPCRVDRDQSRAARPMNFAAVDQDRRLALPVPWRRARS